VSEEPSHHDVRRRLIEVAADVLSEEGPGALSARRLARDAETSTMAVYTHFGGMPGLVRAVVAEGFTPQARRFMRLLPRAVPDLPAVTARFRLTQAMTLTFQVLGDPPQTQSLLAISRVRLSKQQVLDELLDVVTAILAGPPPE